MKLTFLGTRANIHYRNKYHFNHSSLFITHQKTKIIIDCGKDWLFHPNNRLSQADAIFLTHAHPDHAGGLSLGSPCLVYATEETWQKIKHYPINKKKILDLRTPVIIENIVIEAFGVNHSLLAPAIGYRVSNKERTIAFFYVPDLIKIHDQKDALNGIQLYIGDGSIVKRTLLEHRKHKIITGHTPIEKQLIWCQNEGVKKAIFTHCGSEIVKFRNENKIQKIIIDLGEKYKIKTRLAYDGMNILLRKS